MPPTLAIQSPPTALSFATARTAETDDLILAAFEVWAEHARNYRWGVTRLDTAVRATLFFHERMDIEPIQAIALGQELSEELRVDAQVN